MSDFKPMRAQPLDVNNIDFGNSWLSPKLDGIRAVVKDFQLVSKTLKPIPNEFTRQLFQDRPYLQDLDCELISGEPTAPNCYLETYSAVMTKKGSPQTRLYVFDNFNDPNAEYHRRYLSLPKDISDDVVVVPQHGMQNLDDLLELEEMYLGLGYEGIMVRSFQGPSSRYKYGKVTPTSGTIYKRKRLEDFEAQVIGFEEAMRNDNEAYKDATGATKRSTHAENLVGKGTLGKILCRIPETGIEFKCGIFKGLKDADLQHIWNNQGEFLMRFFKCQKMAYGEKDKPRHPRWIGWRDPIDMI